MFVHSSTQKNKKKNILLHRILKLSQFLLLSQHSIPRWNKPPFTLLPLYTSIHKYTYTYVLLILLYPWCRLSCVHYPWRDYFPIRILSLFFSFSFFIFLLYLSVTLSLSITPSSLCLSSFFLHRQIVEATACRRTSWTLKTSANLENHSWLSFLFSLYLYIFIYIYVCTSFAACLVYFARRSVVNYEGFTELLFAMRGF